MWAQCWLILGSSADEKLPVNGHQQVSEAANTSPSLKAAILLAKHGLKAADISSKRANA